MKPERETEIRCSPDHKQLTLNLKHVIIRSVFKGQGSRVKDQRSKSKVKVKGQGSKSKVKGQGKKTKVKGKKSKVKSQRSKVGRGK